MPISQTIPAVLAAAGLAASASGQTLAAPESPRPTMPIGSSVYLGHVHFDLGSGERVFTPAREMVETRSRKAVWIATNTDPCGEGVQELIWDDPQNEYGWGARSKSILWDWGDVAADSFVDAIEFSYATSIPDTDADDNGMGDGVEGFGVIHFFNERDDGSDWYCSAKAPLIHFAIENLPGRPDSFPPGTLVRYTVSADLGPASLTMEFGDSDGISEADYFHPKIFTDGTPPYGIRSDVDGDGLSDFAYGKMFIQPGTFDFDLDGDRLPDGDPASQGVATFTLVAPDATPVYDSSTARWTFTGQQPPPMAQGLDELSNVLYDPYIRLDDPLGWYIFDCGGAWWFGGFSCSGEFPGPDGQFGTTDDITTGLIPYAQTYFAMFGGQTVCEADLNDDGVLDFFDVSIFLTWFADGSPEADLNGDGVLDFFDVSAFLALYNAGCP